MALTQKKAGWIIGGMLTLFGVAVYDGLRKYDLSDQVVDAVVASLLEDRVMDNALHKRDTTFLNEMENQERNYKMTLMLLDNPDNPFYAEYGTMKVAGKKYGMIITHQKRDI